MTGIGETDAVVIGAGINGIVAAARLAEAGWSVALVEAHERIGGFIDSAERTAPGYVHDTWSSWHPLFVTGPAYAQFGADSVPTGRDDGVREPLRGREHHLVASRQLHEPVHPEPARHPRVPAPLTGR